MSAASELRSRRAVLVLLGCLCCTGYSMGDVPFEVLRQRPRRQAERPEYEVERQRGAVIVTVHAGQKPTGGYSVEVRRVERQGKRCVVHYAVLEPPADAMVPQVITYPAVSVRIPGSCEEVTVQPPLPRGRPAGEER